MRRSAADKQKSAVLSLACLAVAVAIFLGIDTLTGGAWSEYRKIRADKQYKVEPPGPLEFHSSPGAYPQPNAPGYGGGGGYRGSGPARPAQKPTNEGTLLWPPLLYFTLAALFAAGACYFFYRAFGPFFIE